MSSIISLICFLVETIPSISLVYTISSIRDFFIYCSLAIKGKEDKRFAIFLSSEVIIVIELIMSLCKKTKASFPYILKSNLIVFSELILLSYVDLYNSLSL